jgi:membrane associated rhomboid family serine protease
MQRPPRRNWPFGTFALILVLGLVFVMETTSFELDDARLLQLGALSDSGQVGGAYWRLLTFGLLHSGFIHLLLNCLLLIIAGPILERRIGAFRMLGIFAASSIASGVAIMLKHVLWPAAGVSVGASGGMFGLLGASLLLSIGGRDASRRETWLLAVVLVCGLAYSLFPGISMVGHLTGLAVGGAAGLFAQGRGPN